MRNSFFEYYKRVILEPQSTFKALIKDNNFLKMGCYAVLIPAALYTLVYIFLIFGGGMPYKPWLNIPLTSYYKYNVFFCAPSMFLGWILAAGVVHTISRIITNKGTFEYILCVFGFGIGIASWATGLHDILTSFLGAIHVINQHGYEIKLNTATVWRTLLWIQMIIYVIWFVILFTKGIKAIYSIKSWQACILGTIGFFVYQFFFFIFNR